jgi:hypothetical protein
MPFRKGFRFCLSNLIYTVRPCLIHTCHAVPLPSTTTPFLKHLSRPRDRMACERHGMYELPSDVQRRHVGDLPAFGFFLLPRGHSQRTRHCRRMARSRHGICELTRQGNDIDKACVNYPYGTLSIMTRSADGK